MEHKHDCYEPFDIDRDCEFFGAGLGKCWGRVDCEDIPTEEDENGDPLDYEAICWCRGHLGFPFWNGYREKPKDI